MKAPDVIDPIYHKRIGLEFWWHVAFGDTSLQNFRTSQTFFKGSRLNESVTIKVIYTRNGRTHSATLTATKGRGKEQHVTREEVLKYTDFLKRETVEKWLRRN